MRNGRLCLLVGCLCVFAWYVYVAPSRGMIKIAGGMFYAGLQGEIGNPVRELEIGPFSMDKYEVTQREYEKVMGNNPSYFENCPDCPVESVTWHEATAYCKKVGKRLPTEWEWEKAAKAGTTTAYYWGDTLDHTYGWFVENSGAKTHPVGEKKPNSYELYDMSGNVWEWTSSNWDNSDRYKILRGGSWNYYPVTTRSATRNNYEPGYSNNDYGFRCVR